MIEDWYLWKLDDLEQEILTGHVQQKVEIEVKWTSATTMRKWHNTQSMNSEQEIRTGNV